MQKQKETKTHGAALDRNTPRSTSIRGHSKSALGSIESSETPLVISTEMYNSFPKLYQSAARLLEREGKVEIDGQPETRV